MKCMYGQRKKKNRKISRELENEIIDIIMDFFHSQLDLGRRVLPLGDCDNFDYQEGCLGHPNEKEREKE